MGNESKIRDNDARVERIAAKLALAWARVPDMRLGQFVVNLSGKDDPFYAADEAMERALDAYIAGGSFVEPKAP